MFWSSRKQKYDLIFSIGEACSCTSALRHAGLQVKSYPLDWLFGSDFIGRCQILASRFNRFIEFDDLEYAYSERSISCDAYHNKYNDLTFNHDFLTGLPLHQTHQAVYKKYMRRISRIIENIESAKHILIVYIETPVADHVMVDDQTLIHGYDIIAKSFPNTDIDILYMSNVEQATQTKHYPHKHIMRIADCYKDKDSAVDYAVKEGILIKHLKSFRLKLPLSTRIKTALRNGIINIIPVAKMRHNLQRKYHVK